MSLPQTSVANPSQATEGMLADSGRKDCYSKVNAESSAEIPFGRMVAFGSGDDDAKLVAAITDKMCGVSTFGHVYEKYNSLELGTTGVKPKVAFDVLGRGRIYVAPEDSVTPASEVHVRMVAGQGGSALVVADFVFTADNTTEIFTKTSHGLLTGDGPIQVSNSGGALPTGLSAATNYWVIKIDADNFYLATTRALALAGTHLSITTDGTGTQTLSDTASTERYVDGKAGAFRGTPDGSPLVYADATFTADNTTEIFTIAAHGLKTGDGPFQVNNSGGALPAGLTAATDYWFIKIDADTFYLATSRANALAGTHLSITTNGTGTQTLSDTVDTESLTTMNISKLARWMNSGDGNVGDLAVLEVDMRNIANATAG